MKKWLWRSLLFLIVMAGLIQFARPEKTNPSSNPSQHIQAVMPVHPEVAAALNRSCDNCHSNNTVWPWYSNVAPVSWLVINDVNEGREELNFSSWGAYNGEKQQKLLGEICNEVRSGEMPGAAYLVAHPQARLTAEEQTAICSWTQSVAASPALKHQKDTDEGD